MDNVLSSASRRLRVFLCHASGDKPAVRDLYHRLKKDGFQPWLDEEDLLPGQDWRLEIPKAVQNSDVVLVCLSAGAINKDGYVQKEIKFALDRADEKPPGTIFIIPARLEECAVPERLSSWHWVNLFQGNGYERLLPALRLKGQSLGLHASSLAIPAGTVKVNLKDGLEYVWIPPGEFLMGAAPGDGEAYPDEKPQHPVRISKGFWLGKTPVTVATYKRFAKETRRSMPGPPSFNPSWEKEDHPIVNVSWDDAQPYCAWAGVRLPTEAEWEYAARGGKEGLKYPWGNEISPNRANYAENHKGTTPVLKFAVQNDWGLHDMAGNVWEWVADCYGDDYYKQKSGTDPVGPSSGADRVVRGGSWFFFPRNVRVSVRSWGEPTVRCSDIGFRCGGELS